MSNMTGAMSIREAQHSVVSEAHRASHLFYFVATVDYCLTRSEPNALSEDAWPSLETYTSHELGYLSNAPEGLQLPLAVGGFAMKSSTISPEGQTKKITPQISQYARCFRADICWKPWGYGKWLHDTTLRSEVYWP